jgi:hypothetical protein
MPTGEILEWNDQRFLPLVEMTSLMKISPVGRNDKFNDESDRTLEEIGKELNVTRERVRQIENSAIKKLKHPKVGRKLKNYIEE